MLLEDIKKKLDKYTKFEDNWDGYNGRAINPLVLDRVRKDIGTMSIYYPKLLTDINIVPSPCGGIQIEWHNYGIDVEILYTGDCKVEFSADFDSMNKFPELLSYTYKMVRHGTE